MPDQNVIPALDRLFRAYGSYLREASQDTLFQLLNALHSLDDRLVPDHGRLFFGVPEYLALKALRNLEHHNVEVKYVVLPKHLPGVLLSTDLASVCLISVVDREAAVEGAETKKPVFRDKDREAFEQTTLQYGNVVDINPCIFNCIVRMFEILQNLGLECENEDYMSLAESYEFEEAHGHSHFVSGRISVHANDVSPLIHWMEVQYVAG